MKRYTRTTTATDGTYSFTGLVNGSYTVTPGKVGYLFDPINHPVTVAGSDVTGIDFSALPCTPLSGILRDAITNNPLSGVMITVDGTNSATTASDGSYNFSCISNGIHTVTVSVPTGYTIYSRTITLILQAGLPPLLIRMGIVLVSPIPAPTLHRLLIQRAGLFHLPMMPAIVLPLLQIQFRGRPSLPMMRTATLSLQRI